MKAISSHLNKESKNFIPDKARGVINEQMRASVTMLLSIDCSPDKGLPYPVKSYTTGALKGLQWKDTIHI
jgi:hypothetical protein